MVYRLLWLLPILGGIIVITFALMHAAPGSPWDLSGASQGPGGAPGAHPASETAVRALNEKYGLDRPWWNQLLVYFSDVVRFDFGDSYQYLGQPARDVLLAGWSQSLALGLIAFSVIVPVGIALGVLSALRQNKVVDHAITGCATLGASVPSFVIGIILIAVFSVGLNQATDGAFFLPDSGFGLDAHLVLPVITVSVFPIALLTRLTRASTLDALQGDYVQAARAKGLTEQRIILRHVVRNSLIPVVTALGHLLVFLIVGSVVVENLFQIQGVGGTFINAISVRDYPVIISGTVVYAVLFTLANLAVDLLYTVIDPRVDLAR